jgi:hypothetical protein
MWLQDAESDDVAEGVFAREDIEEESTDPKQVYSES